jgi:DNA-binding response OmpR family regulator
MGDLLELCQQKGNILTLCAIAITIRAQTCHPCRMPDARSVVIVEDDADIMMLLRLSLEMIGFQVYESSTGRHGIDLVREHEPDLVTLDLGLSDLDGIQVCRRIREFSDTYIMVISARAHEMDRLVAQEIGADDFVAKPFSPHELQQRVTDLLGRPRTERSRPPVAPFRASNPGSGWSKAPSDVDRPDPTATAGAGPGLS